MKANRIILGVIIAVFCCRTTGKAQDRAICWDSLGSYMPANILYDTLEGVFLYEIDIRGYANNDVFVKGGYNFVHYEIPFSKMAYQKGYFSFRNRYIEKLAEMNPLVHYDSVSLKSTLKDIHEKYRESLVNIDSNFNPTYGCYYKKYHLKVEVMYIGSVKQRIPLFANNKREMEKIVRKNGNRDYELCAIPMYIITRVFDWKEIW